MNERQRLDVIKNEMTELFELRCGKTGFAQCVSFAFTDPSMDQWVTVPGRNKKTQRLMSAQEGYCRMIKSLGVEDRFSIAASPRKFKYSAWLSREWDITDQMPDEQFLANSVNNDLLAIVQDVLTLHWKFTGNRSIHLDIFLARPISIKLGKRLMRDLKPLLTAGHACKDNLSQCMRLPFSRHVETGGLCRYAGCHTDDDVLDYIKHIQRDEADEAAITALCERIEAYLAVNNHTVSSVTTHPILEAKTSSIGSVVSFESDQEPTPPTEEQLRVWRYNLNHSPSLLRHPQRTEFMGYIEHGIPEHRMNDLLFVEKAQFPTFIMVMVGVKADAYQYMRYLVSIGISDEVRLRNRLGRVDYLFNTCFLEWQDCEGSYVPVKKLEAFKWLEEFVELMRARFMERFNHRRLVNNLIQVMQYCLLLLYSHPEGATIAIVDVERKLRMSNKTVIGHLKTLRVDFPVLVVQRHHNHFARLATDYVLNEAYVESVLGYSIRDDLAVAA